MTSESEPLGTLVPEGFLRLRGDVSYDGSGFAGWGFQPDQRTVQGDLEVALANVTRSPRTHIQCAGRTDRGVHATGQVFHVDLPEDRVDDVARVKYRLNSVLPDDVMVTGLVVAPHGFDARFSAMSRTYEYLVNDGPVRPLLRNFVYTHGWAVDVQLMHEASQILIGLHDFTSFCRQRDFGTSIRDLQEFTWRRREDGLIAVTVTSDAFCYSMVRMLVGAVLDVGAGRKSVEWLEAYLQERKRTPDVFVAPPHGLTLVHVEYPPDDQLLERSARTRRTRIAGQPDS